MERLQVLDVEVQSDCKIEDDIICMKNTNEKMINTINEKLINSDIVRFELKKLDLVITYHANEVILVSEGNWTKVRDLEEVYFEDGGHDYLE